jgi:cytoskeleton protein RodZ
MDAGVLLKQERERKGILLEVVQEATKIPLDSLKAIEEGYKVRTLTAFYYKSFVKIYAQYLGLDANTIVAMIPTHHPKPTAPVAAPRPGGSPAPASGAGAHRVEGVRSRSWNLLAHPIVLKKKKKILKTVLVAALVVCGVAAVVFAARKVSSMMANRPAAAVTKPVLKPSAPKAVKVQPSVDVSKPKTSKVPALKVDPAKAAAAGAVDPKAVAPDESVKAPKRVSMTVRAQTTTWIQVRADGANVFQGNLKKGTVSTWHGSKRIELSGKNIDALEFEVNGRSLGRLSRRDLKAKRVVVTPEGINVEK